MIIIQLNICEYSEWMYPELQINDKPIEIPIQYTDLFLVNIGEYQNKTYNYVINTIKANNPILNEKRDGIQYTLIDGMIQSLNFIYPNISFDNNENFNYKLLYGKKDC